MKRLRKLMDSPKATMAVFGAAALLLSSSTIGGARAARIYGEENYRTDIATTAISTALVEENDGTREKGRSLEAGEEGNGQEFRLLEGMVPAGEKIKPGKKYAEKLSVENTGETDQYVRVTVYKYWTKEVQTGAETSAEGTDAEGTDAAEKRTEKELDADPGYIKLHLLAADADAEGGTAGTEGADTGAERADTGTDADAEGVKSPWIIDRDASTAERTVLYYTKPLKPGESAAFMDGLTIDSAVAGILKTGADGSQAYAYRDLSFEVKAEVDAVQPRHGEEAILSAWGREVKIDGDGNLSLAPRRDKVVWEEDKPSVSGNEGNGDGNSTQAGTGTESEGSQAGSNTGSGDSGSGTGTGDGDSTQTGGNG